MANTAFDKHVEFCEMYMAEINSVVNALFREGETTEALKYASDLYLLREKYAVWLTKEINNNLETFEIALRKLGANTLFVERTHGDERHESQRQIKIDSSFKLFGEILGLETEAEFTEEHAAEAIKEKVKGILGVEELTGLRKHLVHEASKMLTIST